MNRFYYYFILTLYVFLIHSTCVLAQKIDTSQIVLKAKLLTTSRYGYEKESTILNDIKNQKTTILYSPSKNLLIMKIKFNQNFYRGTIWIGECYYFIAFNFSTNKFYRLGGFDILDITEFYEDLIPEDLNIYDLDYLDKTEINFLCLSIYNKWSRRKQMRRGCDCFPKCSKELTNYLIIGRKSPASANRK